MLQNETAIGDGSILSGLFWLLIGASVFVVVAVVAAIVLLTVWRGGDAFAWVKAAWAWVRSLFG